MITAGTASLIALVVILGPNDIWVENERYETMQECREAGLTVPLRIDFGEETPFGFACVDDDRLRELLDGDE